MAFYIGLSPAWTIAQALKWRRQHMPVISDQSALSELHSVCSSGKVRMNGTRREPDPNWPDAEKIAVRFRQQQPQAIPPSELKCLYYEINGSFQGGTLSWTSSRQPAWWPVHFASDELITAWLAVIRSEPQSAETSGSRADDDVSPAQRCENGQPKQRNGGKRGPSSTAPAIHAVARRMIAEGIIPGETIRWDKFQEAICNELKVKPETRGYGIDSIQNAVRPLLTERTENTEG